MQKDALKQALGDSQHRLSDEELCGMIEQMFRNDDISIDTDAIDAAIKYLADTHGIPVDLQRYKTANNILKKLLMESK